MVDEYDFSVYPVDHPMYSIENKKIPGKFSDETEGRAILEFAGCKAKMYSILYENGEEHKKAKGIKHYVVEKNMTHNHYREVLETASLMRHNMNMFRNREHVIYTITQNKISLSAYDDKRYLLDDGITSLSYGHHLIPKEETEIIDLDL